MKYLKKFAQHSGYESYISGSGAVLPNVSICNDEPGTVHYNPVKVYEYVDLGLTSGKKWAKCNIGAETETDYGDYFMWGSVTPDTGNVCNWAHAPFNNGKSSFDSTYFSAHKSEWLDDDDILKPEYDAAHVIMGGDWKMPTRDDIEELLEETTNEWVTNYQGSGVNGRLFTSNSNGKTLFIPAAGYRDSSSFYQGSGNVWSSSLNTHSPYDAWGLYLFSSDCGRNSEYRCFGHSIRGVL